MLKGLLVGIVIGVLLVAAGGYFYFATGRAPVATTAPDMPFERRFARMALHAYLDNCRIQRRRFPRMRRI